MYRKVLIAVAPLLLLLAACDGSGNSGAAAVPPTPPPASPVITTTQLSRATVGSSYSDVLQATTAAGTGPVTWSLAPQSASMPTGMALAGDGTLSGTPSNGGLFETVFRAENALGGKADVALDMIVYEPITYTYSPDAYENPDNDSYTNATDLGVLTSASPIVQSTPLSVTSQPPNPDVDFLKFTTSTVGEITVDVYFAKTTGKLFAGLHGDHNGYPEEKVKGLPGAGGNDNSIVLSNAAAGTWYLKVEAQYKNSTWNANAYTFRIRFSELTIGTDLVEYDAGTGGNLNQQLQAFDAGVPVSTGTWSVVSGMLPNGVSFSSNGTLGGTPTQDGLSTVEFQVDVGGRTAMRNVDIRVYDSTLGDYWQRLGEHRYYDAARPNGDGDFHEHYCEAMVVAPHPAYGNEGAIYVLGGRVSETVSNVYVFHTAHQGNADLDYKLEDIGRPLSSERQYLGAAFLQHSYGGYIYAVGGELWSDTAPSSGAFTCVVERMKVSDGSGTALATPGTWEAVASLPSDIGGRAVEGWAEMSVVANDAPADVDDRLYLVGGRIRIETAPASATYTKEFNDTVEMFEPPLTSTGTGTWYRKLDASPYTPRRFMAAGMINGKIFMAGGRSAAQVEGIVEMYEPDPVADNAALSTVGAGSYPLMGAVWYPAAAVHNGSLYILNGWDSSPAPQATAQVQIFTPNAGGNSGTVSQGAAPDAASGFHSAAFHDGKLWFITGRDSYVPTPHFSLRYTP